MHRCSTAEVEAAVDRRLDFTIDNAMRLRAVKLDVARIEALMEPFFQRATKGDCDVAAVAAGTLCCKLLERRALLLGLDSPIQSRVDVYRGQAQEGQPHEFDRVFAAIMKVKHGPDWRPGDGKGGPGAVGVLSDSG